MPPHVIDDQGVAAALGPLITGTGFAAFFMPSARQHAILNTPDDAQRTSKSTFARGYKEKLTISCRSGGVWRWRRIVFTFKGDDLYQDPSGVWRRPWLDFSSVPSNSGNMRRAIQLLGGDQYATVRQYLYDGTEGVDWNSEFTAKVDPTNITLLSDRTTVFNPGNETGMTKTYNLWYPLNKTLTYDDEENGQAGNSSYVSVKSKIGMGDLYVYDVCTLVIAPTTGTAQMIFAPEGTYYWRER